MTSDRDARQIVQEMLTEAQAEFDRLRVEVQAAVAAEYSMIRITSALFALNRQEMAVATLLHVQARLTGDSWSE